MTTKSVLDQCGCRTTRRRLLGGAAALAGFTLAGCLGGDAGTTDPVEVPTDAECAVCKMKPANYPEWNAQLAFDDGDRAYFCSPGCLVAYHAKPGTFTEGRSWEDVAGVWAHDYDSKELFDAESGVFVLEMNPDRIDAPMMRNPVPFAERADAEAYADQYDDLTTDDIVTLDAFDVELASKYRGKLL